MQAGQSSMLHQQLHMEVLCNLRESIHWTSLLLISLSLDAGVPAGWKKVGRHPFKKHLCS